MNTPASLDQDQAPAKDIADIERFFSEMTPAHLARLGEVYSADAWFKDPFNEVQGLDAVRGIFQHMYDSLNQPRFIVTTRVVQGRQCFLTWDFVFGLRGASHLWLAPGTDGRWRITRHRDYWDVAEELYEKLPLLGALMRWLKRRVNAPPR